MASTSVVSEVFAQRCGSGGLNVRIVSRQQRLQQLLQGRQGRFFGIALRLVHEGETDPHVVCGELHGSLLQIMGDQQAVQQRLQADECEAQFRQAARPACLQDRKDQVRDTRAAACAGRSEQEGNTPFDQRRGSD